jgi:hypothetical protein
VPALMKPVNLRLFQEKHPRRHPNSPRLQTVALSRSLPSKVDAMKIRGLIFLSSSFFLLTFARFADAQLALASSSAIVTSQGADIVVTGGTGPYLSNAMAEGHFEIDLDDDWFQLRNYGTTDESISFDLTLQGYVEADDMVNYVEFAGIDASFFYSNYQGSDGYYDLNLGVSSPPATIQEDSESFPVTITVAPNAQYQFQFRSQADTFYSYVGPVPGPPAVPAFLIGVVGLLRRKRRPTASPSGL